ncbi:MAG: hypothetical protein AB7K24_27390 [Gemmataceae bacterium]
MDFAFDKDSSPAQLLDNLEKFIVFWFGPRQPEYGVPADVLEQQPLPEPLLRLHAFAGRWPLPGNKYDETIFQKQDQLVAPENIRMLTRSLRIEFLLENQCCWRCVTDATGADPPVYCSTERGGHWKKVSSSLTRFLISFCLQEAALGSRLVRCDKHLEAVYRSEPDRVQPLWLEGEYVEGRLSAHLYRDGILVFTSTRGDCYFCANDEHAIRFMNENQGEIKSILLSQPPPPPEWRSLRLQIEPDGSGELQIHGDDRAALPAGTLDFSAACARFGAECNEDGHRAHDACAFLTRAGQSSGKAAYLSDLDTLYQQFELARQRATDASPALLSHYAACIQHLRDRASGELERRWQQAATPTFLLDQLDSGNKSLRQTRLLISACCRRLHAHLEESELQALDHFEEEEEARRFLLEIRPGKEPAPHLQEQVARYHALEALNQAGRRLNEGFPYVLQHLVTASAFAAGMQDSPEWHAAQDAERQEQARIIRDIIRSPFGARGRLDRAWLSWCDQTIPRLARAAYDARKLPSGHLDAKHLAILADALEEAGCTSDDVLGHLRGPGPHVRGCWAVDLILSKDR